MSSNSKILISKLNKAEILIEFNNESRFVTLNYAAAQCIEELGSFLNKNLIGSSAKIVLNSRDRSVEEVIISSFDIKQDERAKDLLNDLIENKEFIKLINQNILNNYNYELFVMNLKNSIEFSWKQIQALSDVENLKEELTTNNGNNKKLKI